MWCERPRGPVGELVPRGAMVGIFHRKSGEWSGAAGGGAWEVPA